MSTESSRRHLLGLAVAGAAGGLAAACARSQAAAPGAAEPEAPVSQAELDKLKGLMLRTVRPGEAVTMDYRADRLTVEVDAQGKILRASIG
ncbi:I78 family peptidase inhibitor [Inquilinus sp. OTU3971]|uniref:I78 family peptidase inhibitor n=1 Tax=Inquilinus sp. OTU3971 TaxID=3043855 RepID=UPI00313DD569